MAGEEELEFEDLLRRRGVAEEGNADVEREILERYQDDCAVLVLDASGFTRITREKGVIHFLAMVVAMRDRVRPLFEKYEAYAHWTAADNLYGVFPTTKAAVLCALEIREKTRMANEGRKSVNRLDVCIGIGAGRMLRIGRENVYGDPMNIASKLGEDTAGPGEILLSEEAFREVQDLLPDLQTSVHATREGGVDIPFVKVHP
ncbi:MAG: adenylate/guanylate cyclase domain-containing protein [Planctomycetota bacterium]|jgi:class 3 adenylate cyclase